MTEITQEFRFDAAHFLLSGADGNRRVHGHSFLAEVTLRGEPDPETGMVYDLGEVQSALGHVAEMLDHHMLNDVVDLGEPTLENLARFIFRRAKDRLPAVARVCVKRPSCGQSCVYEES